LLQSGNAILIVALLAALLQGLAQLVTQQATTLTLTALLLTTAISFVAIAIAPAGNWRRLYWSSSIILSALCFLTFNVLINLTIWQKLEIFCVVLGIVLIVASYIGRFLEIQSVSDDSVTMGLSLGSLLVAVPLISAVCYYRFHVGAVHWPEELAIVILTIMMLVTGFSWKVKSTTLVGGGTLFLYLLIIIGQLAYQPQVATGVYLAIGGGLVFLMGVCLSMYRDVLLQLPDRLVALGDGDPAEAVFRLTARGFFVAVGGGGESPVLGQVGVGRGFDVEVDGHAGAQELERDVLVPWRDRLDDGPVGPPGDAFALEARELAPETQVHEDFHRGASLGSPAVRHLAPEPEPFGAPRPAPGRAVFLRRELVPQGLQYGHGLVRRVPAAQRQRDGARVNRRGDAVTQKAVQPDFRKTAVVVQCDPFQRWRSRLAPIDG
jgi:hypothetical protein